MQNKKEFEIQEYKEMVKFMRNKLSSLLTINPLIIDLKVSISIIFALIVFIIPLMFLGFVFYMLGIYYIFDTIFKLLLILLAIKFIIDYSKVADLVLAGYERVIEVELRKYKHKSHSIIEYDVIYSFLNGINDKLKKNEKLTEFEKEQLNKYIELLIEE